jgi:hypothetical protein
VPGAGDGDVLGAGSGAVARVAGGGAAGGVSTGENRENQDGPEPPGREDAPRREFLLLVVFQEVVVVFPAHRPGALQSG